MIFSWTSRVVTVRIVAVAGVFVAEDVVGAVALDFVDLLRAARGPRAVVEALEVAVGGGFRLESGQLRVQHVKTVGQSVHGLVEGAEYILDSDRGRGASRRHCRQGGGGSE